MRLKLHYFLWLQRGRRNRGVTRPGGGLGPARVQRWVGTPIRRIVEDAKNRGVPIIYETDDNLLDLPKRSSMHMSEELVDNVKAVLAMADLVTCSTPALADAMARYNPNVQVIENYGLDKTPVPIVERPHLAVVNTDYFKLSESKHGFFRALARAIEDLNYRITFFGSVDAEMTALRDLFPKAVEIVDGFVDERSLFLDRLAARGINVAAAPLDDTDQHLVKSDIKFLDFASLGIPGIFNNRRVYPDVRHQIDGYMTDDTQKGWFEALRYFADPENRRDCGKAARSVVSTARSLSHYADRLAETYTRLLGDTKDRVALAPIDQNRSGFFWQSENCFLLHNGVKRHVITKHAIAAMIEAGFGFIEPRQEEFALVASSTSLFEERQFRGLLPFSRTSTRAPATPASGRALKISWIIPRLIIGGGGHRNIIRCAYHLEQLGHRVSLHFIDSADPGDVGSQVREHFYPFEGHVGLLNDDFPVSDIIFATHWSTVAPAERFKDRAGEIVYFVQDFEPFFYAMGSEYVLAETTYRKGFYAITSGIWCEHFLRTSYGAEADHFQFPIDRDIYFDHNASRRTDRVIFFAKPEMPRRCFEIGVQALRRFHVLRPDVEIVFYGSSHILPVDFQVTQLGMLAGPDDLAKLYSEATVGIAFSTTNPSLVPYEMMACGLPVVDLARTGNEMNYDGRADIALLASPDPIIMAGEIAKLIVDRARLAKQSANGLTFTRDFPVEADVGRRIESLLLKRVRAWRSADVTGKAAAM